MKKLFTFALAAATLIGFSACSNDEENALSDKGYINLNVTTDDMVVTRAEQNAKNVAEWYAFVTNGEDYLWGEEGSKWKIGESHDDNTLSTKPFSKGIYTVSVSNYKNMDDALADNSPYGAAYYEKNGVSVEVKAGETAKPTIVCGKAKNAMLTVSATGFVGSALSVTINSAKTVKKSDNTETDQKRAMTFTWTKPTDTDTDTGTGTWDYSEAFFLASDENNDTKLNYTITYDINTYKGKTVTGDLILGTAGTRKNIKIASNDLGNIVLTITYDDEFNYNAETDQEVITIDGSTGNKVN